MLSSCLLLYFRLHVIVFVWFSRAASNCDLFILTKASLDEAVMYYPNICREIKKAAERKQAELVQRSISSKKKKKDSSNDDTESDRGCKLFCAFILL